MKIIGIDTSTKFLSIGAMDNHGLYEYDVELNRMHSSLLAPGIKRVMDALGWRACAIDYFACGLGPGSFTGVRIGLAAIKGLGLALKKPLVGISSLDILARNAVSAYAGNYAFVIPVLDAKRGLVYYSIYKKSGGSLERVAPYALAALDELRRKIKPDSLLLGDGLSLYKEQLLSSKRGLKLLDKDHWYPAGRNIVILAREKIRKNKINDPFNIKPIYLYPKECQIKK
ncbi:MAG: tRNA (adenosine(37)-N6)-threonylcarbamoyltransferase complex dimerization subunit type 1 TsaB [Candidatus Omnitrophica bacterium]|nr:tRNA (adenosine(37)-N6)-threonylcarbamoyltransferase complex dimerization subunit type 1 TsaB [Candidatus Omnitrophota bacterium]